MIWNSITCTDDGISEVFQGWRVKITCFVKTVNTWERHGPGNPQISWTPPASAVRRRFLNEHLDVSGCSCKFEPKAKQTYHMLVVHIMILKCPKFQCSLPVSHACISISDHVLQSQGKNSEKQNFPPSRNQLICSWCREVSATISTP